MTRTAIGLLGFCALILAPAPARAQFIVHPRIPMDWIGRPVYKISPAPD